MRKYFIALFTALAVMLSMAFVAPAASAAESMAANEVVVEVDATSEATAEVTSVTRAVIDGATQVTWVNPNHSVKVTKKRLRKAPRIRTKCTTANRATQSKQIFKKTRGARVVVVKKGSCLWNMGRYNNIEMGFKWTLKHDAVLVLKGRYYRHAFDLIGGKLVKNCWNFIGKKVDKYAKKVVQVRYRMDIEEDVTIEAKADASAKAKGSLVCPTGTLEGEASAMSNATATSTIRVKVRAKAAAVEAERLRLMALVRIEAEAKAKAAASAKISLKCSEEDPTPEPPAPTPTPTPTPEPPAPPADRKPVVNIMGSPAHLYVGSNAYVWLEASDPDGDPVSVKVSAIGGTVSGLVPVDIRWDGTPCPTGKTCYRAQVWAGSTPGSMSVTATVEANGLAGESDTATFPVVADEF